MEIGGLGFMLYMGLMAIVWQLTINEKRRKAREERHHQEQMAFMRRAAGVPDPPLPPIPPAQVRPIGFGTYIGMGILAAVLVITGLYALGAVLAAAGR